MWFDMRLWVEFSALSPCNHADLLETARIVSETQCCCFLSGDKKE